MLYRILLLIIIVSFSSCNFFENHFSAKKKSLEFVEALLCDDFAKCVDLMPIASHPELSKDTMVAQMRQFKKNLDNRMGLNLKPTFLNSLTDKNATVDPPVIHEFGVVQLANDTCYAKFQVRFDNTTGQVDNIELVSINTVPEKSNLNVFGFFALIVLSFNLFTIWKVVKSNLVGKWKWIIAIVVLNYPTFIYSVTQGPFISWKNIQALFGVSYSIADFDEMKVMIGLPIGAIWVLYKLHGKNSSELQVSDS